MVESGFDHALRDGLSVAQTLARHFLIAACMKAACFVSRPGMYVGTMFISRVGGRAKRNGSKLSRALESVEPNDHRGACQKAAGEGVGRGHHASASISLVVAKVDPSARPMRKPTFSGTCPYIGLDLATS